MRARVVGEKIHLYNNLYYQLLSLVKMPIGSGSKIFRFRLLKSIVHFHIVRSLFDICPQA